MQFGEVNYLDFAKFHVLKRGMQQPSFYYFKSNEEKKFWPYDKKYTLKNNPLQLKRSEKRKVSSCFFLILGGFWKNLWSLLTRLGPKMTLFPQFQIIVPLKVVFTLVFYSFSLSKQCLPSLKLLHFLLASSKRVFRIITLPYLVVDYVKFSF